MLQGLQDQEALLGLGIDAGGTQTRWALANSSGTIVAEGQVAGFSATEGHGSDQARVATILADLAQAVLAAGRPTRVHAGLTGFGSGSGHLAPLISGPLGLSEAFVTLSSDIETAYLDLFVPGQGYLVYAGTGSIAAFIDREGALHRAGGRGVLIDDGGGGYWIAREALRRVWRAEDDQPGHWRSSPLAQELFNLVGGPEWSNTRQYVYSRSRGDVGRLAIAVARAADQDQEACAILREAGLELARLACSLIHRHGSRPVALGGRAATLHPLIPDTMREALPADTPFAMRACRGEHAAARLALSAAHSHPQPLIRDSEP